MSAKDKARTPERIAELKREAIIRAKKPLSPSQAATCGAVTKTLRALRGQPSEERHGWYVEELVQLIEEASTEDEIGMIESLIHEIVINKNR